MKKIFPESGSIALKINLAIVDFPEPDWPATAKISSKFNDKPKESSRAYDKDRDGFVISGGGGTLVLEELEHAKARGAKIYAEIVGYGATSDGYDMVQPSGNGAIRSMKQALKTINGKK